MFNTNYCSFPVKMYDGVSRGISTCYGVGKGVYRDAQLYWKYGSKVSSVATNWLSAALKSSDSYTAVIRNNKDLTNLFIRNCKLFNFLSVAGNVETMYKLGKELRSKKDARAVYHFAMGSFGFMNSFSNYSNLVLETMGKSPNPLFTAVSATLGRPIFWLTTSGNTLNYVCGLYSNRQKYNQSQGKENPGDLARYHRERNTHFANLFVTGLSVAGFMATGPLGPFLTGSAALCQLGLMVRG